MREFEKKPKKKRRVGPNPQCWLCAGTGVVRAYNARKTVKCGECAPRGGSNGVSV